MQESSNLYNTSDYKIIISNIKDGEVLCYSLALIKGHIVTGDIQTSVAPLSNECNLSLLHHNNGFVVSKSEWRVQNFEFKALVDLSSGSNQLKLQYCNATLILSVGFKVQQSVFRVTPVYIVCKGHDGRFQAPPCEDNSIESACQRIAIGARLIQSLTAEKLYEANLGRKTFQLDGDTEECGPACVVFHSSLPVERAKQMEEGELWKHFGRELMLSPLGSVQRKFMAFLACTRYCADRKIGLPPPRTHEEVLAATEAHVALGGGGLALFGTACLHTWPSHVSEVQCRFLDQTSVDTRNFMDDSCYRGTYGACFATTLGSVCHELGHTFDLGHSDDGIMGRGFDNVNLVFCLPACANNNVSEGNQNVVSSDVRDITRHSTVCFTHTLKLAYTVASPIRMPRNRDQRTCSTKRQETTATDRNNKNMSVKNVEDLTFWSHSCAVLLSFHRWFNDNPTLPLSGVLKYESARRLLISKAGIRLVEIRDRTGLVLHYWEFLGNRGREMFILPTGLWTQSTNTLVAEDSDGNILQCCL